MPKNLSPVWLVALAVAWAFDFLFWAKTPGISFAIFTILCLSGGLFLAGRERAKPAPASWPLFILTVFFAAVTFVRLEPFTVVLGYVCALSSMAILAQTLLGGRWKAYGIIDHLVGFFALGWSAIALAAQAWFKSRKEAVGEPDQNQNASLNWRRFLPALRGLALALPVLAVFSALLASADPVFSRYLEDLLRIFRIEKIAEYLFRGAYILCLAYLLAGIFLHALIHSRHERLRDPDHPWVAPFFGLTESAVILGSVNLLFAFFVGIQFRYFFGGQANIHAAGFTYSEYARRGFGELVIVAIFSLLLFLGLSAIARRITPFQRRLFSGLGVLLVISVLIMLVSAFQRLLLYEQAYGFTRLRACTHVFMFWVGILLAAVVGLELAGRLRYFALAALIASLGFSASLPVLNVDGFIARQNVLRAVAGEELDIHYLSHLSADAVPALIDLHRLQSLPQPVSEQVGGVLACRLAEAIDQDQPQPWQSFHLSPYLARRALNAYQAALSEIPVYKDSYGRWMVRIGGEEHSCYANWWE